jgi:hypothetical protein
MASKPVQVKAKLICRRGVHYMSFSGIYGRKGSAHEYGITKTQKGLCDLVTHVAHKTWMTDELMFEVHRIADELSPHGIEVVKHWKILSKRKIAQDDLPPATEGTLQFISLPQAALADALKNGVTRWRVHSGDVEAT